MSHLKIKLLLRNTALASVIALSGLVSMTPAQASWYNPFSWFNSPPNASSLSNAEIKQKAIEFALKAKEDRRIRVGDSYRSTYALVRNPNTSSYVYTVSG